MKQKSARKIRQQEKNLVSLLADIRLKEKKKEHKGWLMSKKQKS